MNDELKKIFEGSDVSVDFQEKLTGIFESTVAEQVEVEKQKLEEHYDAKAKEYAEYVVSEMEDKTDSYISQEIVPIVEKYLDFSMKEFFKENKIVVESAVKVELADKMLSGLVGLAESYNVKVPENQDTVVESLQANISKMESRLDAMINEKKELELEITKNKADKIVESKTASLTESQKEKFTKAAQRVKFEDAEQFTVAIDSLFESHFPVEDKDTKEAKTSLTESKVDVKETKVVKNSYLDNLIRQF